MQFSIKNSTSKSMKFIKEVIKSLLLFSFKLAIKQGFIDDCEDDIGFHCDFHKRFVSFFYINFLTFLVKYFK